ncbi:helix-turn-helix domain-containing protein [Roseivirga sp. E12]|uniref:helix-turn-helix domain-containing protein n=1 Tax=Roseivirga sp. E12 TaxID=2819237 RepID=UPI001ABD36B0|nr:helix-turn-helix domain-containing protein [Roseivirga sp. E12]MBO3697244.1 helix-turn-helix domain-containing protein [Roseivirga sp. E12]
MNSLDILLVIVSSAGLLHGVLFAVYLCFFKKKKTLPNQLLGLILVLMAFRIGKSVMMNFGDGLEPIFIYAGLATLLLIGPLLKWYVMGLTRSSFKLSKNHGLELIPFIFTLSLGFLVTQESLQNEKWAIIIFGSAILFIYLHLALYIFMAWRIARSTGKNYKKSVQTKSQKAILDWLKLLVIGFVLIWISYVLNIVDEEVPYIIGPIVYSMAIYFLSFKAFQLKITDIGGGVFKVEDDNTELFDRISRLIVDERRYLESDLSLAGVSKLVGKSAQKTSSVINQYAKRNFNDFINYHRVQDAKKMLSDIENEKFTISSIAFDTGFSSISSFNSAFKKFEGITPSSLRKNKA